MPIIKVFAPRVDYRKVAGKVTRVIEKYDAFLLAEASRPAKNGLARTYPVEDVTSQYELQLGAGRPRAPRPVDRYRREAGLPRGPHHYVVQFVGPIKRSWLSRVEATGAKLRAPSGGYFTARTARSASARVGTWGTRMADVPMSRKRRITSGWLTGTRMETGMS